MKRTIFLITLLLLMVGCSDNPKELSFDEIKDLPLNEQVDSIIENTNLIDEYEIVIEDNSVAVIYPTAKVADSTLVLSDRKESFPNVAMTLVEHLKVLDFDEIVITSYEPSDSDATGLSRVSALFNKDTINELDFEEWEEDNKDYQHRFYRYSDAYLIRGNIWEKLSNETQELINNERKKSDSEFWDYYGSYIE